jgi:AraC-like DNA-binding protein
VNTDIIVVKASHLLPFISFLDGVNAPVELWLNQVNLDREMFSHPDNLVAEAPFWAFLELAAGYSNLADIGFQVTEQLSLDSFGVFGANVMWAESLYNALSSFISEMGQQSNCPPFWLVESDIGLWFYRLGTQGIKKGQWPVEQHVVSLMIQLVRGFTSKTWTPPYVHLQTNTLKGAEDTPSFKNSQVITNKLYTGVFIPLELLQNKALTHNKGVTLYKPAHKNRISTLNTQVLKALIAQSSYTRSFSAEQTAKALGMSVRQMQRILKQENSSFRALSEQVLFEQAKLKLANDSVSILDIAVEFGYSDAGNFTRAFKRWANLTPTQFRTSIANSITEAD